MCLPYEVLISHQSVLCLVCHTRLQQFCRRASQHAATAAKVAAVAALFNALPLLPKLHFHQAATVAAKLSPLLSRCRCLRCCHAATAANAALSPSYRRCRQAGCHLHAAAALLPLPSPLFPLSLSLLSLLPFLSLFPLLLLVDCWLLSVPPPSLSPPVSSSPPRRCPVAAQQWRQLLWPCLLPLRCQGAARHRAVNKLPLPPPPPLPPCCCHASRAAVNDAALSPHCQAGHRRCAAATTATTTTVLLPPLHYNCHPAVALPAAAAVLPLHCHRCCCAVAAIAMPPPPLLRCCRRRGSTPAWGSMPPAECRVSCTAMVLWGIVGRGSM